MRLPRVRFTVRTMMVAVAVVAVCLGPRGIADIAARHHWWGIKPYLNLLLVPALAAVLTRPAPRRPLIWAAAGTDLFFLALWAKARRPWTGGGFVGPEPPDDPTAYLTGWYHGWGTWPDAARSLADAYGNPKGGLLVDLGCVTLPLLALAAIHATPVRVRTVAAIALVWVRLYDWLVWPRVWRAGVTRPADVSTFGTVDPHGGPALILDAWYRGVLDPGQAARLVGAVRGLEVLVLVVLLVYLTTLVVEKRATGEV